MHPHEEATIRAFIRKRPMNHILPLRLFWMGFVTPLEWRSVEWRKN